MRCDICGEEMHRGTITWDDDFEPCTIYYCDVCEIKIVEAEYWESEASDND
jgi:hypothetical protein